jgi:amino acid adenylation domain-containing protein
MNATTSSRQQKLWMLERMGAPAGALESMSGIIGPATHHPAKLVENTDSWLARCRSFWQGFTENPDDISVRKTPNEPHTELIHVGAGEAAHAARAWARNIRPMDMTGGALVRSAVVHAPDATALVVAGHRVAAGESMLRRLLSRIVTGDVPDEAVRPADFKVDGTCLTKQVDVLRNMLAQIQEPPELLGDRVRPAFQGLGARSRQQQVSTGLASDARAFSRDKKIRELSLYCAAFAVVISRYTRKSDLLLARRIPDPIAVFDIPDYPFDNTVVHRFTLRPGQTVEEWIAHVDKEIQRGDVMAQIPFECVVDEFKLSRDPSRSPFTQILFGYEQCELAVGWDVITFPRTGSLFDLECLVESMGPDKSIADPTMTIVESLDLFTDTARPQRLCSHIETVLRGFLKNEAATVSDLPIVTEAERRDLVFGWNPASNFSSDDTIASRIEKAARSFPDAPAITDGDIDVTYAMLESTATAIARYLRAQGVGRDDRVGVCMDRSWRLIAVLYGVLKAGGAYVPVEPSQPDERLAFVLKDAGPKAVITDNHRLKNLTFGAVPVMSYDDFPMDRHSTISCKEEQPWGPGGASAAGGLAYVIYTSGSTGLPKGCLIEHRHVIRLLDGTQKWFQFDERDVWTFFHSAAFDFSVWEIWGSLCYGGRLVVVPYSTTRSPDQFRELCAAQKVTILNQTPSAFRQFIDADRNSSSPLTLRTVIFGGEALEVQSLRPWFERYGDICPRLINMYGITETTVHVTYRPVSMADLDSPAASIIGVPLPDLRTYVVDEYLHVAPVGVPGELLVAGAGVARGYLNRPELSAQRFLPDTYSSVSGQRLYRSGDLVRWLPNGELDYLGRIDQQIKIRGFRIEMGEVESVLRRSGTVRDVAVVAAKKATGEVVLVAYVVTNANIPELRAAARLALPEYMVPSLFIVIEALPVTVNGKLDIKALPDPWKTLDRRQQDVPQVAPRGQFEEAVASAFAAVLGRSAINATASFFDEGGTSIGAVQAAKRIEEMLHVPVPVIKLFEHTTVESLAAFLEKSVKGRDTTTKVKPDNTASVQRTSPNDPIAIIAMAGRFPGADDIETLWKNLIDGQESITFFDPEELDPSLDPALVRHPSYVRARGVINGPELFDADFFAMSAREAEVTDPQHRIALEVVWEALERAGYDPERYSGTIGVYAGEYNVTYYIEHVLKRPDVVEAVGAFQAMAGNEKDFIATRIAHKLDLKGPSLSIHTACSTSLVAITEAFYALRTGQCDMALAGACAITCPPNSGYLYQDGSMLSPDGHTRTFDTLAQGTVFSDGAAFVLLKRLQDAERDGDMVWAIIRGAAINNDGGKKMSFAAPSASGQAAVIEKALDVAGVDADSIGYIEAHGTATPIGDPIEVEGLRTAFANRTGKEGFCGIGSIKSNFGHLVAASGATGLIKTVLSLHYGIIPPTVHFKTPNPKLQIEHSPFYVIEKLTPWPESLSNPRRAGVSSFGVGGTNAHVIVEQAPAGTTAPRPSRRRSQLFCFSAKTDEALQTAALHLSKAIAPLTSTTLADAAFTLALGRRAFGKRAYVVARNGEDAGRAFTAIKNQKAARVRPRFAMAFSGQGSQYVAMGRALAQTEPLVREQMDRCIRIVNELNSGIPVEDRIDLRRVLDPSPDTWDEASGLLVQTSFTQPALFTVEWALAQLWLSLGIEPEIMVGHSIGEFVAACMAGVFSLEDAVHLVMVRGRLMQSAPKGSMLSVRCPVEDIAGEISAPMGIAAVNAPALCVVAGPDPLIEDYAKLLEQRGIPSSRLRTSHAFHSPMMEAVVPAFKSVVDTIALNPPRIPIVSTVTGELLTGAQAVDPGYWARHLRQTVMFCQAMRFLWKEASDRIVIEVGPRTTLCTLGKQIATDQKAQIAIPSLDIGSKLEAGKEIDEEGAFLHAVGQVWSLGGGIDFARLFAGEERRRIILPTYPFQRKRYWVDPPAGRGLLSPSVLSDRSNGSQLISEANNATDMDSGSLAGMANVFSQQLALMDAQLNLLGVSDRVQTGNEDGHFASES